MKRLIMLSLAASALMMLAAVRTEAQGHGTTRGDAFMSQALGVTKHFMVYLPPSYGTASHRRYPVVYYLHGLGGHETDWLAQGAIDAVADSLIGAGMREAIVVMPDGDDSWYSAWVNPPAYETCRDSVLREAAERACVRTFRYDDYIAHDLVSYVDAHYRTRADRAHRGIGGLSMGGYGALKLALAYPGTFAAAASHSGAVSRLLIGRAPLVFPPRYATSVDTLLHGYFERTGTQIYGRDLSTWQANDPATLASRLIASGGRPPAIYLDCGTEDGLLPENRALDHELTRLGIAHDYHEYPGAHTWRFWNTHVGQSLSWMVGVVGVR
jgi:putative tributyrin esterase